MKLASVILDVQTQALEAPYAYALEDVRPNKQESLFSDEEVSTGDPVFDELLSKHYVPRVGCTVLVPLGGRKVVGFIVAIADYVVTDGCVTVPDFLDPDISSFIDVKKIKSVDATLSEPYFSEKAVACALWMSRRYLAPLSTCIRLFVPPSAVPRIAKVNGRWCLEKPLVGAVDDRWVTLGPRADEVTIRKGALKQEAVMRIVRAGDVRMAELTTEFGNVSSAIKSLENKGAITVERRRKMRNPLDDTLLTTSLESSSYDYHAVSVDDGDKSEPPTRSITGHMPTLKPGQEQALHVISRALEDASGRVVLVDGVTGSGKTEVYLRAIQAVIEKGQTAIVLVPEISLTPQTVARFRGRFGSAVAVMHSRMSAGERYDQWSFIQSGAAKVVVGARSALFTPMPNVGLIVIDEEHESSYKQDSAPRYHARDVAVWMMMQSGGCVVLGSATPSLTSLNNVETSDAWTCATLPERVNGKPMPPVTVVDMAREFGSGHRSMFARELIDELHAELSQGHKAVLLLNQRGFAKFLLCRDCGFVPECPHCSTSLTYHERGNYLMCHHCGYRVAEPPTCPSCGSPYLKKFGAGTQRVEDELNALISGFNAPANTARVIRMDADTTSKKGAHQKLLDEFAASEGAVLLGTQMIAKGLDFNDVTLVGVINADTQLHLPDYRAGERTFDLIQQVAGRAGRANLPGHVFVQTYEAQNTAIRAAATYNRDLFLNEETAKRQALRYPPFVQMANVLVWGKDEDRVSLVAEELYHNIRDILHDDLNEGWSLMPAAPCLLNKLRNTYRWHILIKAPIGADIAVKLGPLFRQRKADTDVNVAVDIDPEDLL